MSNLIDKIKVHHDPAKPVEEKKVNLTFNIGVDPGKLRVEDGSGMTDSNAYLASIPMKETEEKDYEYVRGTYHKPVDISLEKSEPVTVTFDIETQGAEDFKKQMDHIDFTKIEKRILSHYNREIERAMEHEFFAEADEMRSIYGQNSLDKKGKKGPTFVYTKEHGLKYMELRGNGVAVDHGWSISRRTALGDWECIDNVVTLDVEYGYAMVLVTGAHGFGHKRIEGEFNAIKIEEDAT